mmetsp:Transcript_18214/g.36820  ORF Transcript_18214/g.36820 Transcript_18214/m.36820 type:complete len:189 (+) Transcript_18214:937-1503(+)
MGGGNPLIVPRLCSGETTNGEIGLLGSPGTKPSWHSTRAARSSRESVTADGGARSNTWDCTWSDIWCSANEQRDLNPRHQTTAMNLGVGVTEGTNRGVTTETEQDRDQAVLQETTMAMTVTTIEESRDTVPGPTPMANAPAPADTPRLLMRGMTARQAETQSRTRRVTMHTTMSRAMVDARPPAKRGV